MYLSICVLRGLISGKESERAAICLSYFWFVGLSLIPTVVKEELTLSTDAYQTSHRFVAC